MGAHPLVKEGLSLIADFVPGVSNAKSASDLNVGRDIITGDELDELDYASSAAGIAVPSAKGITNGVKFGWKIVGKPLKKIVKSTGNKGKSTLGKKKDQAVNYLCKKGGLISSSEPPPQYAYASMFALADLVDRAKGAVDSAGDAIKDTCEKSAKGGKGKKKESDEKKEKEKDLAERRSSKNIKPEILSLKRSKKRKRRGRKGKRSLKTPMSIKKK